MKKPIPVLLLVPVLLLAFSVPAHSTGVVAGATEFTQIANNIELVAQVGEAVQTTDVSGSGGHCYADFRCL